MDFTNYLTALAATAPYSQEIPMSPLKINTPADLFNPAARDGAAVWVALRLIPVTLILAAVFTLVA